MCCQRTDAGLIHQLFEALDGQQDIHILEDIPGVDVEMADAHLAGVNICGQAAVVRVAPGRVAALALLVAAAGGDQAEARLAQRLL